MSFLSPSSPSIPPLPPAAPPPPQLPNAAVGDAVSQQQQQAESARGVASTVMTSPQGVTQGANTAGPQLAAVMPLNAVASLIGGPNLNQGQGQSLIG